MNLHHALFKGGFESPIEKMLSSAIYDALCNPDEGFAHRVKPGLEWFMAQPNMIPFSPLHADFVWFGMAQEAIGKYRIDLAVGAFVLDWLDIGQPSEQEIIRKLPLIVIECDGHQFHERTAEQAEHDRSRDRWMTAEGFRVMRFTGREIYRSAQNCAAEVVAMVRKLEAELRRCGT